MTDIEKRLEAFYSVLVNQSEPLEPNDSRYIKNLHFDPEHDPVKAMARTAKLSVAGSISYFTGLRGTGKSTELKRLAADLKQSKQHVVLIDFMKYLNPTEVPDVETFLVILATAVAHELDAEMGTDIRGITPFARLWNWLNQSEVKLGEIKAGELKLLVDVTSDFRTKFKERIRGNPGQVREDAREAIAAMAARAKSHFNLDRFTVIIDSLERLRPKSIASDTEFYDLISVLFESVEALRIVGANMIYSVPPYVPRILRLGHQVTLHELGCVRVFENPSAGAEPRTPRDKNGIAKLHELLSQRHEKWPDFIGTDALTKLAIASGGDLRQFMFQLVQQVVSDSFYALDRLPLKKDDEVISRTIAKARQSLNPLVYENDMPVFVRTISEQESFVNDSSERAALARLYDVQAIFSYQNSESWRYANPLLWPRIDRYLASQPGKNAG